MQDATWDGVTRAKTLTREAADLRHTLADHAKAYDWSRALALLTEHEELINSTRPDGRSRYAVLHQAAHGGAPVEMVERLIALGAWRTLRNADGERPIDIARRRGHTHLLAILEPIYRHDIPSDALAQIQQHFHEVIRERADALVRQHELRLPELEPLLEMPEPRLWFAVIGMYGGFHFWLDRFRGTDPILVAESWCRIVEGSGQRHVISPHGSLLIAGAIV